MKKYALVLDVLSLLIFVGIGRSAHEHGITLSGMASTAWPFGVGLLAGWTAVRRSRRVATSVLGGLVIVVVTVGVGMVLRVVSGQGTAFAFVVVALVFLALFMVGWRLIGVVVRGRSRRGARRRD